MGYLIYYFGYIGLRKPPRFSAKRDVKPAFSVKANHPVKTCAVKKKKIQGNRDFALNLSLIA